MKAVKRLDKRTSHRAKMKEMLTKVPPKEGKISKRNRRVFADKTNQQSQEKLEEEAKKMLLDERTMARRSRGLLEEKINMQRKGKTLQSPKDLDLFRLENTNKKESLKKEFIGDLKEEMMDEVTEEITEETKEVNREEDKKWDLLDGLSEYEKIRLENIRQVSTCKCSYEYNVSLS